VRLVNNRIVIGENMRRVRAAAKEYKAGYYQAWKIDPFDHDLAMGRNRRWLLKKMRECYQIVDIGIDPDRLYRSLFYAMEKDLLSLSKYPVNQFY